MAGILWEATPKHAGLEQIFARSRPWGKHSGMTFAITAQANGAVSFLSPLAPERRWQVRAAAGAGIFLVRR